MMVMTPESLKRQVKVPGKPGAFGVNEIDDDTEDILDELVENESNKTLPKAQPIH
jgi:hypothetical protein